MLLYLNGQLADLYTGQAIAQTKQVNDLNSLDNRQANYTNKFRLPKTANNTRIMGFLTLSGNTSAVPYQKTECSLYSDSGECFVYNGRAVVTDGGDSYDVVLYDGIIDLYKAIENKTLASLDLSALTHTKNVASVTGSWQDGKPYRYILADYNGNTGDTNADDPANTSPRVNIDYLVPSVNVAWLWEKIFTTHGILYTGNIFSSPRFTDLWMTYPKGIVTGDGGLTVFKSSDYSFISPNANSKWPARFNLADANTLETVNNVYLKVDKTAAYKLRVKGKIFGQNVQQNGVASKLAVVKNMQNNPGLSGIFNNFITLWDDQPYGEELEITTAPFNLNEGDHIAIYATAGTSINSSFIGLNNSQNELEVELYRVEAATIDFSTAFTDFSIKDFLNEVVQRFGLTLFKDKYAPHYTFLTLREYLESSDTEDWSSKFVKKVSENYIYGSYAQRNYFRYTYNDKEASHNDGYLDAANVNLPESKDLIRSKIYSPEKITVRYLKEQTHVYRMWDKEVKDNPDEPITYKPLDKRYYFMRSRRGTGYTDVYSERLNESVPSAGCYRESYAGLSFYDILQEQYQPMKKLLNNTAMVTALIYLKDIDIANFNFRKRYYIEQLGAYFIMNKISNYVPGKPVSCELIRLHDGPDEMLPPLRITKVSTSFATVKVYFENTTNGTAPKLEYKNNQVWKNITPPEVSPHTFYLPMGDYTLRLTSGTEVSNTVSIAIPSYVTIEI